MGVPSLPSVFVLCVMMMRKLACFCGPILSDFLHKPRQHLKATTLSPRVLKMTSTLQNSNEEHFDVLNEDGTLKGFSKPRSQVHRDGDWHRSTHIWVLDSDGCVLVQKRAMGKDTFPVSFRPYIILTHKNPFHCKNAD